MFFSVNLKKIAKVIFTFIFVIGIVIFIGSAFYAYLPIKHIGTIKEKANKYNLEPEFICAIIRTESRFDHEAVSRKDAKGLMQIIEGTADWAAEELMIEGYTYDNIFDPELNIEIGCWYIQKLITQYDQNVETALAAYNAGSGNVSKWLKNPEYSDDGNTLKYIPFKETRNYIVKIDRYKKIYKFLLMIYGGNK